MNVFCALLMICLAVVDDNAAAAVVDHNAAGKITQAHPKTTDSNDTLAKLLEDSAIKSRSTLEVVRAENDASSDSKKQMATNVKSSVHYGGTKKIVFHNPLSQIKRGKIRYTFQSPKYNYGQQGLARAFGEDFSDEDFGWYAFKCPQMLWCEFNDSKVPAGITFLPSQLHADVNGWQVTKWQFVASKDSICNQFSTWEVICEDLSGTAFSSRRDAKGCFAGEKMQEKHRCFGIRVLAGKLKPKYDTDDKFIITNINMYEKQPGYNQF